MLRRLLNEVISRRTVKRAEEPEDVSRSELDSVRRLIASKELEGALDRVDAELQRHREDASLLLLRAEILRRMGRIEEAKAGYRAALLINPDLAEAWLDLGHCCYLQGDHFWARVYYRNACILDSNNADVWNELGVVEIELGNYEQAELSLEKAVNRQPKHADAWNNLGMVSARRGALRKARKEFLRATTENPQFHQAFANLGLACRELEQLDEAETALRRALELQPASIDAHLTLASVQQDRGHLDVALETLERAIAIAPDDSRVLASLSATHLMLGDGDKAEVYAQSALRRDPENAEARLALAHAQLAMRRFSQGWVNYEARLATSSSARQAPFRRWKGEPLDGKSIYVHGEQGIGDEIMFASCLNDLQATGARCYLTCDPRLKNLFARSFPQLKVLEDAREVVPSDASNPYGIDCSVPIGSLPLYFRSEESQFPGDAYLVADPDKTARWKQLLGNLGPGLKVGIAWRGGLARTGRARRSVDLASLNDLLGLEGIRWVSLQHRSLPEELEKARMPVTHWPDALADLDETAALIASLDAVVSVCSSVVHMAGALGTRVFVLTPYAPAWRYGLSGTYIPWYRSARLCRQVSIGDWSASISEAIGGLRSLLV